jgi:formylglycine-generating enzyme required for sulfatase activity
VFLQARDALARMQSFAKELKWSRVTKEHGLLTKEVSLPGEKGRKLLADLREVAQAAVVAGRTLVETRQALTHAVAARKFEEAGILCRQITELDPTDVAIAAREAEWAPELQAAKAAVDAGRQALAEQDYRTAKAKADEALALCADLPAAAELRQQCEVGLDGLRQLVSDARARVGAVRELTQAGRLTDARTALASLLAQYENVEVPEDAEVAPDWIEVSAMLAAVEGELAAREREALQRQAARRRRRKQALVAIAITLMGGLGWYLAATTVRHRAMAREQLVTAERHAAFVATARRAASAGDWTTAEQEVAKALALDAKGTETLALAAELEPTLTVTAELDGHEVAGAQIAINGATQQQTTPASYKLERGKTYAFSVSLLPKDGRFYTIAETGVTADWRGPKSWSAKVGVGHGPAEGQAWTVPELGMELLWVAPGGFQMGSADGDDDEKPVHSVRLARGFWLAKHEVIQAEYEQVMGKNPSKSKDVRNPVEFVSWNDAAVFCGKLTAREHTAGRLPPGYEYRLPTEAEWEYAARGGPASKGYTYAGSNSADEVAWYDGNSSKATHPVGQKKPNELGLYDMSGNVWELCLDGYGEFPSGTVTDPVGPANEWALLVARGGALNSGVARCRVAVRSLGVPGLLENFDMGFRACLAHVIAPK